MSVRGVFMKISKRIYTLDEMAMFAESIAQTLFPGFVLCLSGDLGAGKTTLTQFLGKAMGIKDTITSPTFTILKSYKNALVLHHIDAYRLEGTYEDFELEEAIYSDGVSVIEWYENIIGSIPDAYLSIDIDFVDDMTRELKIEGRGKYETIVKAISD